MEMMEADVQLRVPTKEIKKIETKITSESQERSSSVPVEFADSYIQQFDKEMAQDNAVKDEYFSLMQNAIILIKNDDFQLALNILEVVLDEDPDHVEATRWAGYCYTKLGNIEESLKYYLALACIKEDMVTLSLVAELYYQQGLDQEAREFYHRALEHIDHSHPILFEIYKNLGNISTREGDLESAEESYNKAYTMFPRSDVLLVNYGTLELQRGDFEKALGHFRAAIDVNANNDKAWVGLALIHNHLGDFELSIANLEKALDLNPTNETAVKLYVEWGTHGSKLPKVIARLKHYLDVNHQNVDMAFVYVKVLVTAGRFSQAEAEMRQVLSKNPEIDGGRQVQEIIKEHLKTN